MIAGGNRRTSSSRTPAVDSSPFPRLRAGTRRVGMVLNAALIEREVGHYLLKVTTHSEQSRPTITSVTEIE